MKPAIHACAVLALLAAGCAAPAERLASTGASRPAPPNIIFILADDLGYGDLGSYGQERIQTPRLDRMAQEGMRFTQFYAGSTVCAPSRSVLMTGQHTGHTYIRGNLTAPLPDSVVTVAETLRGRGYRTALIGKWGLGNVGDSGHPRRQGFDYFFGFLNQMHAHNHYPEYLFRNDERIRIPGNETPGARPDGPGVSTRKTAYAGDLFIEEALGFIEGARNQPFFLYLALTTPHANNEGKEKGMEVPSLGAYADASWPEPEKGKAAMITRMDAGVGQILDRLAALGLEENTLVVFTSDNGPHKEGGSNPDFLDSNGPLRGIKRDLYEGGIRVPFIARWPGKTPAGAVSDYVGYFADMLPTFAELAGVSGAASQDGVSIVAALTGRPAAQQAHEYLYWEFYEGGTAQAVRFGDLKAVRKPMLTGEVELYDLRADVGETRDLAAARPAEAARARAFMEAAHRPSALKWVPQR